MPGQSNSAASPAFRKIRRLGIAVVAAVVLYSAGWYYVASKFESALSGFLAEGGAGPVALRCDGLETGGFPFLIGFTCKRTAAADRGLAGQFSAGALRAAARIYSPGTAVAELDGPADVTLADGSAITASWSHLRTLASANLTQLTSLSAEGKDVALDVMLAAFYQSFILKADDGQLHLRDNKGDLEAAVLARNFRISEKGGADFLPALSTSAEVTLAGQAGLLSGHRPASKAMAGTLKSFKLELGNGIFGEMSGPFSIDADGYLSGSFSTTLEKLDLWEKTLLPLFPDAEGTISGMAALLKGLAKGEDKVTVKLEVDAGLITLSMFPIGHIPPI